jgi:hypothetical protein
VQEDAEDPGACRPNRQERAAAVALGDHAGEGGEVARLRRARAIVADGAAREREGAPIATRRSRRRGIASPSARQSSRRRRPQASGEWGCRRPSGSQPPGQTIVTEPTGPRPGQLVRPSPGGPSASSPAAAAVGPRHGLPEQRSQARARALREATPRPALGPLLADQPPHLGRASWGRRSTGLQGHHSPSDVAIGVPIPGRIRPRSPPAVAARDLTQRSLRLRRP